MTGIPIDAARKGGLEKLGRSKLPGTYLADELIGYPQSGTC